MLVRIVKSWIYPDLARQTPGGDCTWEGVQFTFDPVPECDVLLILNAPHENITVRCPPENVWALFQEPYVPGYLPWMREGHQQYARVYTNHSPSNHRRYRAAPPLVPWHVEKTFDELVSMPLPRKSDDIVWITSNLQIFPGHKKRYAFYKYLTELGWDDLAVYGRGIKPVSDKWGLLEKSFYAIAIENQMDMHYWTEKVADCWLAYTLPFYFGCINLEEYFPAEAFIRLDLSDFAGSAARIRRAIDSGEYKKRLPAIREARDLVLRKHQFFPFFSSEVRRAYDKNAVHEKVFVSAYHQSFCSRLKEALHRWKT